MKTISLLTAAAATIACGLTLHGDVIEINQAGFAFSPNDTSAAPGDTLRFNWSGGTHSVTSGTSCVAGNSNGLSFNEPLSMANPIVEVTIPADFSGDLNYFCDVMSHCEAFNMVGVVHVKGGSIPGDFNDDGQVNGGDLGGLLAAWGTTNPTYDLSGDGAVDGGDLGMFLSLWTG